MVVGIYFSFGFAVSCSVSVHSPRVCVRDSVVVLKVRNKTQKIQIVYIKTSFSSISFEWKRQYFSRHGFISHCSQQQFHIWVVSRKLQLIVSCYICWLKFICNRISSCFDVHLVKYTYSSCLLLIWTFR